MGGAPAPLQHPGEAGRVARALTSEMQGGPAHFFIKALHSSSKLCFIIWRQTIKVQGSLGTSEFLKILWWWWEAADSNVDDEVPPGVGVRSRCLEHRCMQ